VTPTPAIPIGEFHVLTAMQYHGGAFVKALADAWFHADADNRARLRAAFPDIWDRYAELAARTRDEWRPWVNR